MTIIRFLFYIVYRVFKLIPRREPIDHTLASSFLSVLLTTNIIMCSFFFKFVDIKFPDFGRVVFQIFIFCIFIGIYFYCKWYFIKSENYKEIIAAYDEKYKSSMTFMAILGVVYIIGSFYGFYALAVYLSEM